MTKSVSMAMVLAVMAFGLAQDASAQIQPAPLTKGFVNVNFGAQPQRRTFETSTSFGLYDETATMTGRQHVGNGPVFDFNAGYRVWRDDVAVAIGFTGFSDTDQAIANLSIPNPVFFNRPAVSEALIDDIKHSERTVYLLAVYRRPITSKIDVAVGLGPAFIKVSQDVITGFTVAPGTQTATVTVGKDAKTATGVSVGFDGTYLVTPRFGAGLFLRYAGATADLPTAGKLKVGGLQGGLGLRVRF